MAKTDLTIPSLGEKFVDLRGILPGDAYNWSWERNLSQVGFLAIHHTGTPDNQTPEDIAQNHINKNGWGGIGYHFLIDPNGLVYYVGDISTARANVANLNEQVIGIGLIGNFISEVLPTSEQLDSAHKLCEYLLNYQDLPNLTSWDNVLGHKELPAQTTICPGDNWKSWKTQILQGIKKDTQSDEEQTGLLKSQVDSLQTSLASVNQQAISLQEALQERDQQIAQLKQQLKSSSSDTLTHRYTDTPEVDTTLTITDALINLYKSVFLPRRES